MWRAWWSNQHVGLLERQKIITPLKHGPFNKLLGQACGGYFGAALKSIRICEPAFVSCSYFVAESISNERQD